MTVTRPEQAAETLPPGVRKAGDPTLADLARTILDDHAAREEKAAAEHAERQRKARAVVTSRLQRLLEEMPHANDEPDVPPWEDAAEYQALMKRRAWTRSLEDGMFDELADWQLDDVEPDHARIARMWMRGLGPQCRKLNLILPGSVGAGKTSLAIAVGNALAEQGRVVRIVSHEQYLTWLRPGQAPDGLTETLVESRYRRHTDVLILDDLGAEMEEGASDHAAKKTVALLGDRKNAKLPTIITTNLSTPQMKVALGARSYSRFAGGSAVIPMVGPDRREPVEW